MENPVSPDSLSDLPVCIIRIILSLLSIRDAIRTSILSRQWRYIWNSIPDLVFRDECVKNDSDRNRLVDVISQVLLLHKGTIHKFQLRSETMIRSQYMDQWLLFLSRNHIRILVLDSKCDESTHLHSSLYSCQYLTRLELRIHKIPPPPQSFNGFLWLRSLSLYMVKGSSTTIESIVACSPLLEKLEIESCGVGELTIRAPNLKNFHFDHSWSKLSLFTPLLEELLGGFMYMQFFSIGAETFQGSSPVFPHLRIVELADVPFGENNVAPAVIHLITSSPKLQKLKISGFCCPKDAASQRAWASLLDTKSAHGLDSLKVIKMQDFCDVLDEMKLVKFLLSRSPVLEKMTYAPYSDDLSELPKLKSELGSFHRASANAKLVLRFWSAHIECVV